MKPLKTELLVVLDHKGKISKRWKNQINKYFVYHAYIHSQPNFQPINRLKIFIETKILTDLHLNFIYNWGWKNNETH